MKFVVMFLLVTFAAAGRASAQIPAEWQAAAQLVVGELERDQPHLVAKPWTHELTEGWKMARAWRRHNNRNVEIILAEYLTFVAICRVGCAGNTIEGQPYRTVAEQVKALHDQMGGSYGVAAGANAWLAALPDPTGAAAKNAAMWNRDPDRAAADFATGNLYALYWLLGQAQPTPPHQAGTFARFALFVQGRAWIGARCLDITKVATLLDAPPQIEACK
ncbi:hypothetical protein BH11PSE3_BH11PSE3_51410 [soil metagenome]